MEPTRRTEQFDPLTTVVFAEYACLLLKYSTRLPTLGLGPCKHPYVCFFMFFLHTAAHGEAKVLQEFVRVPADFAVLFASLRLCCICLTVLLVCTGQHPDLHNEVWRSALPLRLYRPASLFVFALASAGGSVVAEGCWHSRLSTLEFADADDILGLGARGNQRKHAIVASLADHHGGMYTLQ